MNKSNWYVISGGPCAGKTTVIDILKNKGYRVEYEAARVYIDQQIEKGKTIEEIRKDEGLFQKKVLKLKIAKEKSLPKDELIIFDRGIPDSLAYYEIAGLPTDDPYLKKAVADCTYRKVFLLDLLEFEPDYARTDFNNAKLIQKLLAKYYKSSGFQVIKIPKIGSAEERTDFIIKNL